MQLGTFGAIFRFALELEEQAVAFYQAPAEDSLKESFDQMARGSGKRHRRLERARREGVTEMILESIEGLDSVSYHVDLTPHADLTPRLDQATALEETTSRFYRDAAAKMPIEEIVRIFQRLAQESIQRRAELVGLRNRQAEMKPDQG